MTDEPLDLIEPMEIPAEFAREPEGNGLHAFARAGAFMPSTPNHVEEALAYCRAQHRHLDPPDKYGSTWTGDCQAFCHVAYGLLTGGNDTAYHQWLNTRPDHRYPGGTDKAPLGALLFSKGRTPYGHVMIACRPFRNGTPAAWSTDLWRTGQVGKVPRTWVAEKWGHDILGWGTETNGHVLDLTP